MLAMFERVGVGEGLLLHAFVVHAHHGRHARGIAVEVGERADHLGGEADVGDRELLAVAVAAGLLVLREMALDRLEGRQGPVREPEIAARFFYLHFLFKEIAHPGHDQRMPIGRGDEREAAHRSEEHTSELQSQSNLVCRLLLEKKKKKKTHTQHAKEESEANINKIVITYTRVD